MKILFYDLETTGLDPQKNAIRQLTSALMINGEIVEIFDMKIQPWAGAEISPEALAVSGVTMDDLKTFELPATAYTKFVVMLDKHCDRFNKKDKIFLCGYNNAAFDNGFLRAMFERNYNKYFGSYFWSSPLDVFVYASFKLRSVRHLMEDFKQGTVAKALGIEVDDSKLHDASYDLNILIEIYKKLIND